MIISCNVMTETIFLNIFRYLIFFNIIVTKLKLLKYSSNKVTFAQ